MDLTFNECHSGGSDTIWDMKQIHIYFPRDLISLTDSKAAALGITRSDYVRRAVVDKVLLADDRRVSLSEPQEEEQKND